MNASSWCRLCNLQAEEARYWKERDEALQLQCGAWLGRVEKAFLQREEKVNIADISFQEF